jgi:uncharacterized protein
MTPDDIRTALETAEEVPEEALHAAVANASELAPAVIAVMQAMADGRLPLPREEKLLRFGLHALSVARETSACPALLALLRRPPLELEWLFGDDERSMRISSLLLGLFDGDDAAVHAVVADPQVDADTRVALLEALARLAWEGRASREALVALLDRFDREELAPPDNWVWFGWHNAIMLLGLTDWIDRVERAHDAGRQLSMLDREPDRQDWLERVQAAADHPEDPQRFIDEYLVPYDDPVKDLGWSPDPPAGPGDPLTSDELAWLDLALWRRVGTSTMCLEWADGYLSALAVGPEPVPPSSYLPAILGAEAEFDTPEHGTYVAELLERHLGSIVSGITEDGTSKQFINFGVGGDLEGSLWGQGYLACLENHDDAWRPLLSKRYLVERLVAPLIALLPGDDEPGEEILTPEARSELIDALPFVMRATWSFWHDAAHPLLELQRERAVKVGRNDPCPCGSGKKYKRCCGAVA